jgi:hypothetical protein
VPGFDMTHGAFTVQVVSVRAVKEYCDEGEGSTEVTLEVLDDVWCWPHDDVKELQDAEASDGTGVTAVEGIVEGVGAEQRFA